MTAQAGLWELQKGILTKLAADASIQALVGSNPARIYDIPPPDAQYPFILIGDMKAEQWGARDIAGAKVELSVQSWANQNRGSGDIKRMGDAVTNCLDNATVALAAGTVVLCQYDGSDEEETKDGVLWMGTTRFSILLQTSN